MGAAQVLGQERLSHVALLEDHSFLQFNFYYSTNTQQLPSHVKQGLWEGTPTCSEGSENALQLTPAGADRGVPQPVRVICPMWLASQPMRT